MACGKDLQCLSKIGQVRADVFCKEPIERLAQFDMKWEEMHIGGRFSKISWKDMDRGVVTYMGDKAKFQTPAGVYINVIYACDIDPADYKNPVKGVRLVRPGRL